MALHMFHVLASRILLTKEFDWKIITFYTKKKKKSNFKNNPEKSVRDRKELFPTATIF